MATKIDLLKRHFRSGRTITQLEAIGLYSAFRLAARVHELKAQGWDIITDMREDPRGTVYAEYRLARRQTMYNRRPIAA